MSERLNPLDIPGVPEAIEKDHFIWNAAFLPISESIAGFEVQPLTLRHYLILRMVKSPLLSGLTPSPVQLSSFLWILNKEYHPKARFKRYLFLRRCRKFVPPAMPLIKTKGSILRWQKKTEASLLEAAKVLKAAREYVDEVFADRPPGSADVQFEFDYYSDAAGICAQFADAFGWDDEITLDKPMKRLFQYMKRREKSTNPKALLFNRANKAIGDWLKVQNANN